MSINIKKDFIGRIFAVIIFGMLTIFGFVFSMYLIYNADNFYTYVLAFSYLILSIIAGLFNTFTAYSYYRSYLYDEYLKSIKNGLVPIKKLPTVAVAMAIFNENTDIVTKNMKQLLTLKYPKNLLKFYILDDSTDKEKIRIIKKTSEKLGYNYIHRTDRKGYKAGALNNIMNISKEEFLAIFDYDEYLTDPYFLEELLPYFKDKKLAYIQTEKRYKKHTFFSDTIDLFDAFFFKFIQPSRALNNTAIFAGSCGIIKMDCLRKIGGFPEYVIEDTFFSFESDLSGYKSLYVPKVYAYGKPIETFTELVKQQWRYNYGDTQFLGYFISKFKKKGVRKKLSPLSNMDYMTHGFGLNYISVMLVLFTLVSILIVFSQLPVTKITLSNMFTSQYLSFDLELLGMGALFVSIIAPIIITKIYFNSISKGIMIFLLNFSLAFIRAKAAFAAIFRKKYKIIWDRNNLLKNNRAIYAIRNSIVEISFAILLFLLSLIAIGINNIFGGIWLIWYGILYASTLIMFYKYR